MKTHSGNALKIVREHYVRDDIPCGHPACGACSQDDARPRLSDNPTLSSVLCPFPHYIVPDTNVLVAAVRYSDDIGSFSCFKRSVKLISLLMKCRLCRSTKMNMARKQHV